MLAIITSEDGTCASSASTGNRAPLALGRDGDRPLADEQARALARRGKAMVWIDFGLHSSEVATRKPRRCWPQRVVTEDSEEMRSSATT